jgi:hypothetical protein
MGETSGRLRVKRVGESRCGEIFELLRSTTNGIYGRGS